MGLHSICLHSKLKAIHVGDEVKVGMHTHGGAAFAYKHVCTEAKNYRKMALPLCSLKGSHCETNRLLSVYAPRAILVGACAPQIILNTATTRGCLGQQGSGRQLSRDVNC